MHEMPPHNRGPWDPYLVGGDQQLICHLMTRYKFPSNHKYQGQGVRHALKMGIDYNSKLFVSAYKMNLDREIGFTKNRRVVFNGRFLTCSSAHHTALDKMCQRWTKSKPPATFPVVLHFNGKGPEKEKMFQVASRMSWPQVPQAELWSHAMYSINHNASAAHSTLVTLKNACEPLLPQLACGKSVGDCLSRRQNPQAAHS